MPTSRASSRRVLLRSPLLDRECDDRPESDEYAHPLHARHPLLEQEVGDEQGRGRVERADDGDDCEFAPLRSELEELRKNGARLRVIGNREGLAADIVRDIAEAENMTAENARIDVNICINYGSRDEILRATRRLAQRVAAGEITVDGIDQKSFEHELLTAGLPDPDLLIRTSGEQRISNFLLWQCAYSELVFVDTLWPDFGKEHLEQAIVEFRRRERRYGGVGR